MTASLCNRCSKSNAKARIQREQKERKAARVQRIKKFGSAILNAPGKAASAVGNMFACPAIPHEPSVSSTPRRWDADAEYNPYARDDNPYPARWG